MAVDISKAKKEAEEEVEKEDMELAKRKYKSKLQELKAAEKVVKNVKRELEDLDDELSKD